MDELVASIKKTEESLQRLKRLRKGADTATSSSSANDVSDESKIRKQLLLDVQQFGKEVRRISFGFMLLLKGSNQYYLKSPVDFKLNITLGFFCICYYIFRCVWLGPDCTINQGIFLRDPAGVHIV